MQTKKEEGYKDILETFRRVQVNIPLLDAIKQVPKYAKFLKELCTTRKKISNKEVVKVGENVSAILQRKLPPKCKDPADQSNAYPKRVLKDVLVQVNHVIFLADFYVLEMEDSAHASSLPILLRRPFMKTACTKIDVFKMMLSMEFYGEVIDFNLSETIKYPSDDHSCFSIDVIDSLAQGYLEQLNEDALEMVITKGMGFKNQGNAAMPTHDMHDNSHVVHPSEDVIEMVATLESLPLQNDKLLLPISSSVSTNKMLPSVL
ncbi:uncharacterized protein LOC126630167 [Malus sylvestris]|uniref:uncharacterized protein LOC126630167 n=1 Tax=Malus sylvestris TaxID=3752 RepID=UPI0021ABE437|nr:uncharacterized protein LOC126630167 [Malus sylvestris]